MNKRLAALVLVLGTALALSGCGTKVVTTSGAAPLYTVTAAGNGEVAAPPDVAEMYFGSSVIAQDASGALSEASKNAEAIASAVKNAGVASEDIQTANVSVYPEMGATPGQVTGYRASVQVRVKIRTLEDVGAVISAASDAGANEIGGPSFTIDNDADVRNQAIELAIADARKRGEVMAKAAGKTLGEIISVSEGNLDIPIYYDRTMGAAEAASVPIEPGQLDVRASVTVVFELK